MALEDLTDFDKINIGAALLNQLKQYQKLAKMEDEDNAAKAKFEEANGTTGWDNDGWDNYWNNRVFTIKETINHWDPSLLDKN